MENITKTIKIDGMTCDHCVGRVENSIKKIDGVEGVSVSLESCEAKVVVSSVDNIGEKLDKAVIDAGCKVVG
jgi:copper chaperone CopZ